MYAYKVLVVRFIWWFNGAIVVTGMYDWLLRSTPHTTFYGTAAEVVVAAAPTAGQR
jgi:hypothetical protein